MGKPILVIGATSYLGQRFVREAVRRGYEVVCAVRNVGAARMLFSGPESTARLVPMEEAGRYPSIAAVNFAFIKEQTPHLVLHRTRDLIAQFLKASREANAQLVVQISTMAVFGYALDRPPVLRSQSWMMGDAYSQAKALAERMVLRGTRESAAPAVLRLGNIMGPEAPTWTALVAQRLAEGRPVGIRGYSGFSNVCWADNTIDYLLYLIEKERKDLKAFGPFHHLAEWSSVPWGTIVSDMAATMEVEKVELPAREASSHDYARQLANTARQYLKSPLGGPARAVAAIAPPLREIVQRSLERYPSAKTDHFDHPPTVDVFLRVMTTRREFSTVVMKDWRPTVTYESGAVAIGTWLQESGFTGTRIAL